MVENNDNVTAYDGLLTHLNRVDLIGYLATKPLSRVVDGKEVLVVKLALSKPLPIERRESGRTDLKDIYYLPIIMFNNCCRNFKKVVFVNDCVFIRGYIRVNNYYDKNGFARQEYLIQAYDFQVIGKAKYRLQKFLESKEMRKKLYVTDYEIFLMEKMEDGSDVISLQEDKEIDEWLPM